MKTLTIEYSLLNDPNTTRRGTFEVEDWWTECFIIDEFWNRFGRYKINKTSIKIIGHEEHR